MWLLSCIVLNGMTFLFLFVFFFFTCPSCLRFSCCAARCFLFVHKGEMQSVTNQLTFTQAIICLWFLYLNTAQTFGQAICNQVSIKLKHGQNWECVLFASMMTLFYAIWITIPSSKRVQIWTFRCQHLWFVSCKQSRGIQNCRTYTVKYKLTVFLSIVENIYICDMDIMKWQKKEWTQPQYRCAVHGVEFRTQCIWSIVNQFVVVEIHSINFMFSVSDL